MTATAAWSFTAVASSRRREVNSWLLDMDGVLLHESHAVAGADRFLTRPCQQGTPFLVLTNNSIYTRRDLAARLRVTGLEIPEGAIAGLEAGLETILLLTDVATRAEAERHPYHASCIVESIADLVDTVGERAVPGRGRHPGSRTSDLLRPRRRSEVRVVTK
jgi:ribonucleotide monophosphatase NagD (HAD superfamily)